MHTANLGSLLYMTRKHLLCALKQPKLRCAPITMLLMLVFGIAVQSALAVDLVNPDFQIVDEQSYQNFRSSIEKTEYVRTAYLINPKPRVIATTTALMVFVTQNPHAKDTDICAFLETYDSRLELFSLDDPNLLRGSSLTTAIKDADRIFSSELVTFDARVGKLISAHLGLNAPQYVTDMDPTGGARVARALSYELSANKSLNFSTEWASILSLGFCNRDLDGVRSSVNLREVLDTYLLSEDYDSTPDISSFDDEVADIYTNTQTALQEMPFSYAQYLELMSNLASGLFTESTLYKVIDSSLGNLGTLNDEILENVNFLDFEYNGIFAEMNSTSPQSQMSAIHRRLQRLEQFAGYRARSTWANVLIQQSSDAATRDYGSLSSRATDLRLNTADSLSTAETVLEVGSTAALLGVSVATSDTGGIVGNAFALTGIALGLAGDQDSADSENQQIFDEIQAVRAEIELLGMNMDRRFDDIESQLNTIYQTVNTGLSTLGQQLDGIQQDIEQSLLLIAEGNATLDRLEGALWAFAQDALLAQLEQDINLSLNPTNSMDYADFLSYAALFEGYATGTSLAASTAYSGSNPPVMMSFGDFDQAQEIIGAGYGSSINEIVAFSNALSPGTVPQSRLVSPSGWSKAAAAFVQLCEEQPWHVKYSFDTGTTTAIQSRLDSIILEGEKIKSAQQAGRSEDLFQALITNHGDATQIFADYVHDLIFGDEGIVDTKFGGLFPFALTRWNLDPPDVLPKPMTIEWVGDYTFNGGPPSYNTSIDISGWGDNFWGFMAPSQSYILARADAHIMTSVMMYIAGKQSLPFTQSMTWREINDNGNNLDREYYDIEFEYTVSAGTFSWSCKRIFTSVSSFCTRWINPPGQPPFLVYENCIYSGRDPYDTFVSGMNAVVSGDLIQQSVSNYGFAWYDNDMFRPSVVIGSDSSTLEPSSNSMSAEEWFQSQRLFMKHDLWDDLNDDVGLGLLLNQANDWFTIMDSFTAFFLPEIYDESTVIRSALGTSIFDSGTFGAQIPFYDFIASQNVPPSYGADVFEADDFLPKLLGVDFSLVSAERSSLYSEYISDTMGQSTHSYLDFVLAELNNIEASSKHLAISDGIIADPTATTTISTESLFANDTSPLFRIIELESFTQPEPSWGSLSEDGQGNLVFTPGPIDQAVASVTFEYIPRVSINQSPNPGEDQFARSLPATVTLALDGYITVPSTLAPDIMTAISVVRHDPASVIELAPGTYRELVDTMGKAFTLRSASGNYLDTIISGDIDNDGTGDGTVFNIVSGEGRDTVIKGITIRDGLNLTSPFGGGVYIESSGPIIESCWITGNRGFRGGAASNLFANAMFLNCLITGNTTPNFGGAFRDQQSNTTIANCTIADNFSGTELGRAITATSNSYTVVVNSIIWEDVNVPVYITSTDTDNSSAYFTHTNIRNGIPNNGLDGPGNIDADPMFVNPTLEDFSLPSGSPSVDSGASNAFELIGVTQDLAGNDRYVDDPSTDDTGSSSGLAIVDMGAFELQVSNCPADLNGDGELDFFDVSAFLIAFNAMDPIADLNADGSFNFFDVSVFLVAYGDGCP